MIRPLYIGTAVAVFLGFLIVMAPASLFFGMFRDDIVKSAPELAIGDISGSIWSGSTMLQYGQFPPVEANWTLKALPLLTGRASAKIVLSGTGIAARVEADLTGSGGLVRVPGATVDAGFINPVTAGQGVSLAGEFTATDLFARFDDQWVHELSGQVNWPGGLVHIQTPQQYYSASLPPLKGQLSSAPGILRFGLADKGLRLVDMELKRDGWARLDVTYDFMILAGLPVPGTENQNGQASAVIIEEKIL